MRIDGTKLTNPLHWQRQVVKWFKCVWDVTTFTARQRALQLTDKNVYNKTGTINNFHEFQHRKYLRKLTNNNAKNNSIILAAITFTAVTFNKLATEDSAW